MSWRFVHDKFSLSDYKQVYEGNIELDEKDTHQDVKPIDYLEHLFYIFNINHPKDFKGHSLSVSDVVELDGKKYYCDSAGWQEL